MADYYRFMGRSGLGLVEPIAMIGDNVALYKGNSWFYFKVTMYEPIPWFQFLNLGAVAANTTNAPVNATNLDMFDNEFGQFRWFPIDNAQILRRHPNITISALKTLQVPVDMNIVDRDPCLHLTEFCTYQDQRPQFQAINGANIALTQCRLIGGGWRFSIDSIEDKKYPGLIQAIKQKHERVTYIICQGFGGGEK